MSALRNFLPTLAVLLVFASPAQDTTDYARPRPAPRPPQRPFKDRLYFGGGLGLSFGTVTFIQVEPLVGVHLDPKNKLSVGTGVSYWYYRDSRYVPELEQSGFGYRFFGRYRVLQPIFLHAEFYHVNVERYDYFGRSMGRDWVPHGLIGGGYVQGGEGVSFYLQVLWEVFQDPYSVYAGQGPILSAGVGVGF